MVPVDGCRIVDEAFAANTGGTMPPSLTSVNGAGGARSAWCFADAIRQGPGAPRRNGRRAGILINICIRSNFLWNVQTA